MTARIVALASGSGTNLQAVLDACGRGIVDARVTRVVVNRRSAPARDRARAAGVPEIFRPVAPFAEKHPDDVHAARRAYDAELAAEISVDEPDWIVLVGWMHVFSSAFLDRFPNRVVNLHPALPGEFPGSHAIDDAWAAHCAEGLERTGVMVHLVPDEGIDDGPVLAVREVAIEPADSRESLESRIHDVEHELIVDVLAGLCTSVPR